jgi:hypothetical protein
MKPLILSLCILIGTGTSLWAQEPPPEDSLFPGPASPAPDTAQLFMLEENTQTRNYSNDANPFLPGGMTGGTKTRISREIIIEISRSFIFSKIAVGPSFIETRTRPGFSWDIGIKLPFKNYFFCGAALQYLQIEFDLLQQISAAGDSSSIQTRETSTYCALPLSFGCKYNIGIFSPFIRITGGPALFTSGNYLTREKVTVNIPDEGTLSYEKIYDVTITADDRRAVQAIIGISGGFEIEYGYGSVCLSAGVERFLLDPGSANTRPLRTASSVLYFPIALGLYFTL